MAPTTSTTPGPLYGKKILSFEECSAGLLASAEKKKIIRKRIATASPFALKTRQLILKPNEEAKPVRCSPVSPPSVTPRTRPRNKPRRLASNSSSKSRKKIQVPVRSSGEAITPTGETLASRQGLDFKTPSTMVVKSAQSENAKPSKESSCEPRKGTTGGISCSHAPLSTPPVPPATVASRKHPKSLPSKMTASSKPTCRSPLQLLHRQDGLKSPMDSSDDSTPSTRRNLDKRTARLKYCKFFEAEIQKMREQQYRQPKSINAASVDQKDISIFVRKRPIFQREIDGGDFDVVDAGDCKDSLRVYETKIMSDMKKMTVQPIQFRCTEAFSHDATNAEVYERVGQPLLFHSENGGLATLLMFGQTGSGKTYTMTAIEEMLADNIFASRENHQRHVGVQFIELAGQNCNDLLTSGTNTSAPAVRIVDRDDGSVNYANAVSIQLDTPSGLKQLLEKAKKRRATEATNRNDVSSRSHAVCRITLFEQEGGSSCPKQLGVMTLVDCAGSERRNDSMYHSRSRQGESVEINKSIYALKECIRARSESTHVPYRESNLTRVLRESFENPNAELSVIATVAPTATDTEHTRRTLETVLSLWGISPEEGGTVEFTPMSKPVEEAPNKWSHEHVVNWLSRQGYVGEVPQDLNGKAIMRMTQRQLQNTLYQGSEQAKAERLFQSLRKESDRVALLARQRRMEYKDSLN